MNNKNFYYQQMIINYNCKEFFFLFVRINLIMFHNFNERKKDIKI